MGYGAGTEATAAIPVEAYAAGRDEGGRMISGMGTPMVYLPDGSAEFIADVDGLYRLIAERLGPEAADLVRELADDSEYRHQVAALESELDSYAGTIEVYAAVMREAIYCLEEITVELRKQRIDKRNIIRRIERVVTVMNREL